MLVLDKIFDKEDVLEIKKLNQIVDRIEELECYISKHSDEELREKTNIFKLRLKNGETLDDILPEAFAVVREASKRVLGMRQYRVQLIGGIVLHQGKIAEMRTGEGKTLVAVAPVYLNALTEKGVHVVTVNDYLAKRDKEIMEPIYNFLGMEVGVILHDQSPEERKLQYKYDITYGTNNEYGFDYLRDNMVSDNDSKVQRDLNFAIIDEVDSILIDEARTPLIISGQGEESSELYILANKFISTIMEEDFEVDEKDNTIFLTENGMLKAEKYFNIESLTNIENMEIYHHINQALRAHKLMKKNIDYVIRDNEIMIVDEFTGRIMEGRRYSEGLHQAIEAKENVEIKNESKTLATVTFQNYFRMYQKLCGMTGTAKTEEGEFQSTYRINVVEIPTNKPVIRADLNDFVFKNKESKYRAVVEEIKKINKTQQPILVGTTSIKDSETLSDMLKKEDINHQVLNAKHHGKEAEIVKNAGKLSSVTIATNMAGRGTDIVLGAGNKDEEERVKKLGGLYVIGTERHETRRIDNQLRGRSGRQGDPGTSRFFVSLEDEVIKLYGGSNIEKISKKLNLEDTKPIEHKNILKIVERAQRGIEGKNFESRKNVLQYDDVINEQRKVIYSERNKVLNEENLENEIQEMVLGIIKEAACRYLDKKKDYANYLRYLYTTFMPMNTVLIPRIDKLSTEEIVKQTYEISKRIYDMKIIVTGVDELRQLEREILLKVVDSYWINHIDGMDQLRQGIGLRALGQIDPVKAYTIEGSKMFDDMVESIRKETIKYLYKFN